MKSVDRLAEDLLAREGGFVNDPDDPGGPTNHGVTLGTLKDLGHDVNGDGHIDISDVRALTKSEAKAILLKNYYEKPRIPLLPEALRPPVFDMYVNSGRTAVTLLQQLLNDMGLKVAVDGAIGPATAAAATKTFGMASEHLVDAYGIARRNRYYALADRRPSSRKYVRRKDGGKGGWITRAEDFISPRYHLTDDEHARRVASWS